MSDDLAVIDVTVLSGHVPYYVQVNADRLSDALRALADKLDSSGDYLLSVTTEFVVPDDNLDDSYYAVYAVLDRTAA